MERVQVVNAAAQLPFPLGKGQKKVSEELRLRYRYLDLRGEQLQRNIRMRSRVMRAAREHLYTHAFTEIETPTLFKSTPEGAREFIVPTRRPNKFFSLVQSPQQVRRSTLYYIY